MLDTEPKSPRVLPAAGACPLMTEWELRESLFDEELPDRWLIVRDGRVCGSPRPLAVVFHDDAVAGADAVQLMHASQLEEDDPACIRLQLSSKLNSRQRKHLRAGLKHYRARIRRQLLGVLAIVAGASLYFLLSDPPELEDFRAPALSDLSLRERIEQQAAVARRDERPTLRTVIAKTQFQLLITNTSDDTWPRTTVYLESRDGFSYESGEPIRPDGTLAVPLREFRLDGEAYDPNSGQLGRIIVEVPGYRPFDRRF